MASPSPLTSTASTTKKIDAVSPTRYSSRMFVTDDVLLTREAFRDKVFARDRYLCVVCGSTAQDSHHILERKLWSDGGYYADNGVSVCGPCHYAAEQTLLSCEELREKAGIRQTLLPPQLYRDVRYDKFGNIILDNGMRLKGELFEDESVQKVLAPVLHLFTDKVKAPRTYHLPWSPGLTNDDRIMDDVRIFEGRRVVVTAKMDGESCSCYTDYIHARSLDYDPHESRDWMKKFHASFAYSIPQGMRVCGENLYAKHAIHYQNLESYFQVFGIWDEHNVCLSWDETVFWVGLLGLTTVPVLYDGIWNETTVRALYQSMLNGDPMEGYVVRTSDEFLYKDFRKCVGKFVRAGHVADTVHHWKAQKVIPNKLAQCL